MFSVACPEGTYVTDQDTCDLCPVGTYNSLTEVSTCISCPDGTTSYTKGNIFPGSCTGIAFTYFFSVLKAKIFWMSWFTDY